MTEFMKGVQMTSRKYNTILLDADGTILDFEKASRVSFSNLMEEYEIQDTEENYELFNQICRRYWSEFELGKIDRTSLVSGIYGDFFSAMHRTNIDYYEADKRSLFYLSQTGFLLPGALEFVKKISKNASVFILTNGYDQVQRSRLQRAGVMQYVSGVYTSEQIGFSKPQPEYFQYFFNDRPDLKKEEMIMLGDSIASDISGAKQAGIDACLLVWNETTEQKNCGVPIVSSYEAFCEQYLNIQSIHGEFSPPTFDIEPYIKIKDV